MENVMAEHSLVLCFDDYAKTFVLVPKKELERYPDLIQITDEETDEIIGQQCYVIVDPNGKYETITYAKSLNSEFYESFKEETSGKKYYGVTKILSCEEWKDIRGFDPYIVDDPETHHYSVCFTNRTGYYVLIPSEIVDRYDVIVLDGVDGNAILGDFAYATLKKDSPEAIDKLHVTKFLDGEFMKEFNEDTENKPYLPLGKIMSLGEWHKKRNYYGI